jgi:NCS2 family nucleobase:cation symporter-2
MAKPSNLIYGVDEKPPIVSTLLLALQHTFVMSSTLILPVVIVSEIGGTLDQVQSVVSYSMIAAGLATILQSLKKGPVGSGYLCPHLVGPSYLSASIQAAWLGGLPLLFGMTAVAGFFEALFSRVVRRLRVLFPTEVTGLVVVMVGIALVPLGTSKFLGIETEDAIIEAADVTVAAITLMLMIGLNIWSHGRLRLYCVLIGMVIGYLISYPLGILQSADLSRAWLAPFIALPDRSHISWSFDVALLVPFIIASLASSLKTVGDLMTAQKVNDDAWVQADMKSISGGLLADGIGCMSSGVLGGLGVSTSSSNVGVSAATGATSRRIGLGAGCLFILLAFFPKLSALFSIMPQPVMGAILVFVTSFMVIAGIQIILTTKLDARKTFVIGISLIFGLSVDILPELYRNIHPWLRPLFSSSLTLSTILAIVLTQLFRIGSGKPRTEGAPDE